MRGMLRWRSHNCMAACIVAGLGALCTAGVVLAQSSDSQNVQRQNSSGQPGSQSQQNRAAVFIKGTVRDVTGAVIAGGEVTLEEKGGGSAEARTGSDGTFSFLSLRAGTFTVRAKAQGFQERSSEPMQLLVGETKRVDLVLKVAAMVDPIKSPHVATSPSPLPEFSDEPKFTVAGVTDWSNAGLHGSDVTARTSESLTKDTLALKSSSSAAGPGGAATAPGVAASTKANDAEAHRLAGDEYEKKGDALGAEREYEAAVRIDPSEPNYFAWGTELLVHRAVQPAIEVYGKGVAAYPSSSRMLVGLGAALYASRSYDDAARRVCQASDLQPGDATPYLVLGKIQETAADVLPCAEERLGRFVREQSSNAEANYYYAIALWKGARGSRDSGSLKKQEDLLKKAVRVNPKFPEAYVQLGNLYFAQKRTESAIAAYKKAAEANPELVDAHYRLGLVYKRTGESAKAEQEFAAYKRLQQTEAEAAERERKEMQQFVVILKSDKKE